jgi:hypothetical protein
VEVGWLKSGGRTCWMYFIFICENKTMKPVEMVLRGKEEWERMMEGVNLIKVYCKHIYRCHNITPCATIIC